MSEPKSPQRLRVLVACEYSGTVRDAFIRAGHDAKLLNDNIDAFVAAALAKNGPVSLINYPAGDHGFEILNNTDETRGVIAQSIGWVKSRLREGR